MASGDVPPEVIPRNSNDSGIHSFTKLAIAYIGILLGLTIISAILGAVVTIDNLASPTSLGRSGYLIAYYVVLIPLMLATIELLRKGRKLGAYLAYASMVVHYLIYFPTILFLVASPIVGILLWRSYRYLR